MLRRLALWFADRHAQPWRERLESDRIGLGTGDRTLTPKGRLDPTYRHHRPAGPRCERLSGTQAACET